MTSDQARTIDALSLFYGGWAKATEIPNWQINGESVYRVSTAGIQPNYSVLPDGTAINDDGSRLSAEEVQMAVYGPEVVA